MATAEIGTFGTVSTPVVPSHPAKEPTTDKKPRQLHRLLKILECEASLISHALNHRLHLLLNHHLLAAQYQATNVFQMSRR